MVAIRRKQSTSEKTVVPAIPGTKLLGIKVRRQSELVGKVKAGFRFEHLLQLEEQSGLTRERICQFAGIAPRTLARRQRTGQLTSEESDRLLRSARIFEMVVDLFEGDEDEARRWLLAPSKALGGVSPLEFTSTEVGAREVENLIGRLQHGVFT